MYRKTVANNGICVTQAISFASLHSTPSKLLSCIPRTAQYIKIQKLYFINGFFYESWRVKNSLLNKAIAGSAQVFRMLFDSLIANIQTADYHFDNHWCPIKSNCHFTHVWIYVETLNGKTLGHSIDLHFLSIVTIPRVHSP